MQVIEHLCIVIMVLLGVLYAHEMHIIVLHVNNWDESRPLLAFSQILPLDIFICVNVSLTSPCVRLLLRGFLARVPVR